MCSCLGFAAAAWTHWCVRIIFSIHYLSGWWCACTSAWFYLCWCNSWWIMMSCAGIGIWVVLTRFTVRARYALGYSLLSGPHSDTYIVLYKFWRGGGRVPVKVHAAHVHFMLESPALWARKSVYGWCLNVCVSSRGKWRRWSTFRVSPSFSLCHRSHPSLWT